MTIFCTFVALKINTQSDQENTYEFLFTNFGLKKLYILNSCDLLGAEKSELKMVHKLKHVSQHSLAYFVNYTLIVGLHSFNFLPLGNRFCFREVGELFLGRILKFFAQTRNLTYPIRQECHRPHFCSSSNYQAIKRCRISRCKHNRNQQFRLFSSILNLVFTF